MSASTKKIILDLWLKGLKAADPGRAVSKYIRTQKGKLWYGQGKKLPDHIHIVAIGKAALLLAKAASSTLGNKIEKGLVIVPHDQLKPSHKLSKRFQVVAGDHPVPMKRSLRAGRLLKNFVQTETDTPILFLISGGTSSLVVWPKRGVTLRKIQIENQRLLKKSVPIHALVRARKKLSAIKGGKLLAGVKRPVASLIISDVVDDRIDTIGGALTVSRSRRKNVKNHLVLPCHAVAKAIVAIARRQGLKTYFLRSPITGDASRSGMKLANTLKTKRSLDLFVSFGESTVKVKGRGKGGRNLEFALGAALKLQHIEGITLYSSSTDGMDGNSRATGAFVDSSTCERARAKRLDPQDALKRNNSAPFFDALGDLVRTGPTGVNSADVQIAYFE